MKIKNLSKNSLQEGLTSLCTGAVLVLMVACTKETTVVKEGPGGADGGYSGTVDGGGGNGYKGSPLRAIE